MEKDQVSFWQKNRLMIKAAFIGLLTLLLLIPMAFIGYLVDDREQRHDTVSREISSKWASAQTLAGPILVVPYRAYYKDDQGKQVSDIRQAYFLPDSLSVNGNMLPEKRHRGIYEAILYRSDIQMDGNFKALQPESLKIPQENWLPDQAYLILGVDDVRGIESPLSMQWNDSSQAFKPGMPPNTVLKEGLYIPLSLTWPDLQAGTFNFSIHLKLKGSGALNVIPVGKTTAVHLQAAWQTPSFVGSFLPDAYSIKDKGFDATWKISNLNRNMPQSWTSGTYDLPASAFGVNLMLPVDTYQKTMRCVKYAILIIALTFIVFFLVESAQNNPVHPFQYVLIGFALCIFYTLLLSLSEYIHFDWAYAISTVATTGLICLYTSWLFRDKKAWLLIGLALLLLYGFIFTLVQLEDFSLLFGSIGLFITLALLMYYSRKINREHS